MATGKGNSHSRRGKGKAVLFLHKPNCTTCRKARTYMERRGYRLYFRDLAKEHLSATELEKLIGPRDYTEFLNSRNEVFRRKKMKANPPPRKEAIRLMAKEPNLIRRPLMVLGKRLVAGFDPKKIKKLFSHD
jgi:Spx/MgsR family transcriptional regulator